jgi:TolB-like protein
MSPEQITGRVLDHRTDIFSPWRGPPRDGNGPSPVEGFFCRTRVIDSGPAAARDRSASDLPAELARVIRRCLEKDPRERVQTARDVGNEIRDLGRVVSRTAPVHIAITASAVTPDSGASRAAEGFWVAVLPFKYTGSEADLSALAEGVTDDIVTGLSRFSYLKVIARGSTARYARETADVRTVARDLGARYVMEGSVRQAGAKVRIGAQLVDATSGAGLWAQATTAPMGPTRCSTLRMMSCRGSSPP